MPFTDEEKTEILRFLRYPDWVSLAASVQLGYPAASEPMYLVVDAFKRMTPTAEGWIRRDLCELRAIEAQLAASKTRMLVTSVNGVKFNASEPKALLDLMTYWERRLADDFGVAPNPFSQAEHKGYGGAGGINAKVSSS